MSYIQVWGSSSTWVFESSAKWQGYLGSEEISACTQVKSASAFLHKVSEEEELKKETATLKAGTHYRAGSRAEELSCVETAAEWWARGEIPWNAGQSTSKAKRMLCLLRKGTHKKNKINKKRHRTKLQQFLQPYRQRIKSLTSFTTHHPSVTFSSVELPENELSHLLRHKSWA